MMISAHMIFLLMMAITIPCYLQVNAATCSQEDITISQSQDTNPGLPNFIVEISNTCLNSTCAPSNIHVHCGVFASASFVNPTIFKRLVYDDCLVNGGNPLQTGRILGFTYSNNFKYPLSFKSAKFC